MKELQDKLSAHRSSTPSRWREKAMERQANKEWLRYSQKIAMMMLDKMEELRAMDIRRSLLSFDGYTVTT